MGKLPSANKDLGQHFLKDQKVIDTITKDFSDQADIIIEIGPGPAILTQKLSEHEIPFYVVEKDKRFIPYLDPFVEQDHLFIEDALKFNWEEFINKHNLENKKIWLVSNLPYNISSVLFVSFLKVKQIHFMSLMFQKEVGEKTYHRAHEKNQMSSLLVLSQTYFDSKLLLKVLPGAFNPPPKVDSVVVSYQRKDQSQIELQDFLLFEKFLRQLFQFKRKQIGSVLKGVINKDKKDEFFTLANVSPTLRAEALSIDQVYALYNSYLTVK